MKVLSSIQAGNWANRLNRARSCGELNQLVAGFMMVLDPCGHKNILDMNWDDAADNCEDPNGDLAQLLRIASDRWCDLTDASDDGCCCHIMRGETCSYCMQKFVADEQAVPTYTLQVANAEKAERHALAYSMGPARLCDRLKAQSDPDGEPHGHFGNQIAVQGAIAIRAASERTYQRSESLRFIHQPAKSLREELRLGVVYEDR